MDNDFHGITCERNKTECSKAMLLQTYILFLKRTQHVYLRKQMANEIRVRGPDGLSQQPPSEGQYFIQGARTSLPVFIDLSSCHGLPPSQSMLIIQLI